MIVAALIISTVSLTINLYVIRASCRSLRRSLADMGYANWREFKNRPVVELEIKPYLRRGCGCRLYGEHDQECRGEAGFT